MCARAARRARRVLRSLDAVARKDYNESVQLYNVKVRTFPNVIIAPMLGFQPAEFFQVSGSDKETPNVDFGTTP